MQKLQQYDKPFLLFQHDVKEQTEEKHYCSHVDHYHLLTVNGNPSTGSDATYCYIKNMAKNFDTGYDCQPVRFFNNLIQYLRQKPRLLIDYHSSCHQAVTRGEFTQVASTPGLVQKSMKQGKVPQDRYSEIYRVVKQS